MSYLGDLIGHLIAEITISRMQADIESVRIAELYANHPLLKHFSVPRFRLPNVTLEVPVAIAEIEEAPKGKEPRGGLNNIPELIDTLEGTIRSHLQQKKIKLSDEKYSELKKNLLDNTTELIKIKEVPVNLSHIAEKLTSNVIKKVREIEKKDFIPDTQEMIRYQRQLQFALRRDLLKYMEAPPRLRVLATTKDLAEIKDPDRLLRLRLTVSEEGVEWTMIELEGKPQDRLIPE